MAQATRRKENTISPWVWFLSGIAVGAIGMGLVTSKDAKNLQQKLQERMEQVAAERKAKKEKPPKPRFDFYNVLPDMEVVIPEEEIHKPPKKEPLPPDAGKQAPVYLLQMGSFSKYKDADRLKAKLGFMGIESDIQSVTISNARGKTSVHRVRGGPYSQAQAQALHKTLQGNGIKSMMIRLKK